LQSAQALLPARISDDGFTGSVRWHVKILADAVQTGRIDEVGKLDLPGQLRG
jgi:hypothetical protein